MYTSSSFLHSSKTTRQTREGRRGRSGTLTRSGMVVDVCLVLAWGATIPGLMWLGVASGF